MPFNYTVYYYFLGRERGAKPADAWQWGMQLTKWWATIPDNRPAWPTLKGVNV